VNQTALPRRLARNGVLIQHPIDLPGLVAWLVPFILVLYLAVKTGGYDPVVRGQVGIAAWWIILVGVLAGVLPCGRLNRGSWWGLALLAAFMAWTAVSLSWTESQERTAAEVARVGAYLGVFALAIVAQGRAAIRHVVNGLSAAIGIIAVLAVAYRLHPDWFSVSDTDQFFAGSRNRLSYPLGYWNALAALMAIGLPLAMHGAATARFVATRALAAAAGSVMLLCAFLTVSRGGVLMIAVGALVYLALAPGRFFRLCSLVVVGAGGGVLIAAADHRDAVKEALAGEIARQQSAQMLRLVVIVAVGVGLVQVALSLLERHVGAPRWLSPSRRTAGRLAMAGVGGLLVAFVVAGGPAWTGDRWEDFKRTSAVPSGSTSSAFSRFSSLSSNGRYQYWQLSAKARDDAPLQGTGSGTFEFLWSRDGAVGSGFVRDAHSLWMETQGELGWIGFLLIAGFLLGALGVGAVRALREPEPRRRHLYAAGTAGVAAFCAAACIEWVWELTVLPIITLMLAAAVLGGSRPRWVRDRGTGARGRAPARLVLSVLAAAGLTAVALPLAATTALRDSQAAAGRGDLGAALAKAKSAAAAQPYAASPDLQQALIFERTDQFDLAAAYARMAIRDEPTNWRPWIVLSRLEAKRARPKASVAAFRRARTLNRRSPIFAAR
jgi:hypothetical protein